MKSQAENKKSAAEKIGLEMVISEKALEAQGRQTITFRVKPTATKGQIASAVREEYKTEPQAIRTLAMRPKRRTRGRAVGWTKHWKKALVTVEDIKNFNLAP
jgi:large subunit ribosomal protein L23